MAAHTKGLHGIGVRGGPGAPALETETKHACCGSCRPGRRSGVLFRIARTSGRRAFHHAVCGVAVHCGDPARRPPALTDDSVDRHARSGPVDARFSAAGNRPDVQDDPHAEWFATAQPWRRVI